MLLVTIVILWLISPIVLTVLLVLEHGKSKNYKLMYENLLLEKKHEKDAAFPEEKPSETVPSETAAKTVPEAETVTAEVPETAAVSITENISEQPAQAVPQKASPYNMPYNTAASSTGTVNTPVPVQNTAPAPVPKKEKVSSMNIMLILGALFIIISGLIFATTTWKFLSSGIRAVVIFSFSAIFFAVSSLAERKLKLEKTGMLFYTLGSVFLPITLIASGYFKVFGEWFSLDGDGSPLLWAVTFLALTVTCIKGACDYKNRVFAWAGLTGFSAAVCSLILQFTHNAAIFSLAASVYGLAVIFVASFLAKRESESFAPVLSQLNGFAAVNTIILSISTFFAMAAEDGNGVLTLLACVIFASGYLKNIFTEKNGFGGAIPFSLFVTCGIFSAFSPETAEGISGTIAAATAVPAVFSVMDMIPDKLKTAFRYISGIFAAGALLVCGGMAFDTDPTWISFAACAFLAAEILALGLIHRNEPSGKLMLYVFPVSCVVVTEMLSSLVIAAANTVDYDFYRSLMWLGLIAAMQVLFMLLKKPAPDGLRTVASDYIFGAFAVIAGAINISCACEILSFSDYTYGMEAHFLYGECALQFAAVLITAAVLILPAVFAKHRANRLILSASAFLWCGTAFCFPLERLLENAFPEAYGTYITAAATITAGLALLAAAVITLVSKDREFEIISSIAARVIAGMFLMIIALDESVLSPILALLMIFSLLRYIKKNSRPELVAAILLFIITVGRAAVDIWYGVGFDESLLFMSGAAVLAYVCTLFAESASDDAKLSEAVLRYALGALTCGCMLVLTVKTGTPIYMALTAIYFLMTVTAFYNARSTAALLLPLTLIYPAVSIQMIDHLSELLFGGSEFRYLESLEYVSFHPQNLAMLGIIALSVIMSYILHRGELWKWDGKKLYLDGFFFTRFIGIWAYLDASRTNNADWCGILLFGLCLLTMTRKNQSFNFKRIIYTVCAFAPVIAWVTQPFFEVPEIIELELNILPFLIYCAAMRPLWKDRLPAVDIITFCVYVLSYVTLFFSALSSGEIVDGLIIVISSLLMLIFSFIIKMRKWFILAVTVLVVSALFMSRNFWASLAWWIYLLGAGLILIAIGAANEMKKQSAAKPEKSGFEEKITRFMSEWKW